MEYRKLGRTSLEVSALGLGTEHLASEPEVRDEILRLAVEAGVNYVDMIYIAPDYWQEFGPILQPYREKLVVAAHWGANDSTDVDESQRCFDGILSHLGGYAEVAMMTMVDSEARWLGWAQESMARLRHYQAQGRVGHIGLSSHNESVAIQAVKSGQIDVLMFPVNLLGHDDEGRQAVHWACVTQGVGLVAMKAYHGGTLFRAHDRPSGITPVQCLHYVLSQPVSSVVPGPRTVDEMRATLHYLEASEAEKDYGAITADLKTLLAGQCVYCQHCLPCPEGIEIGWLLWLLDYAHNGVNEEMKKWYADYPVKPSACTECGICLARCPFGVDIPARLRQVQATFEAAA